MAEVAHFMSLKHFEQFVNDILVPWLLRKAIAIGLSHQWCEHVCVRAHAQLLWGGLELELLHPILESRSASVVYNPLLFVVVGQEHQALYHLNDIITSARGVTPDHVHRGKDIVDALLATYKGIIDVLASLWVEVGARQAEIDQLDTVHFLGNIFYVFILFPF